MRKFEIFPRKLIIVIIIQVILVIYLHSQGRHFKYYITLNTNLFIYFVIIHYE